MTARKTSTLSVTDLFCGAGGSSLGMHHAADDVEVVLALNHWRECAVCEARSQVERAVQHTSKIHPEWDDEDWLDHLYRVFPEAFKVGVLPDYWYELRGRLPVKVGDGQPNGQTRQDSSVGDGPR